MSSVHAKVRTKKEVVRALPFDGETSVLPPMGGAFMMIVKEEEACLSEPYVQVKEKV